MGLPKLNAHIQHQLTIPSTGKKVFYRPYLVKEEQVLMQAMETGDKAMMLHNLANTIQACLIDADNIKVQDLTIFDIDYMFLKIRSKSVGETTDIGMPCQEKDCDSSTVVTIDFDSIKAPKMMYKMPYLVELTDDHVAELVYPPFKTMQKLINLSEGENKSEVTASMQMAKACILAIRVGEDSRVILSDYSDEEIEEFINDFTSAQFKMLQDFVMSAPEVSHKVSWACDGCKTKQEVTLKGTADFFQ